MMLIGDGVTPGNESRGYVLRRLLRRAVRSMRLLGVEDRILPELMPVSRDKMGETYTELISDWERISTIAYAEEDAFRQTLRTGTTIFDVAAQEAKSGGETQLSGSKAFALHDTYGFPIDLTLEMASEQGLSVDEEGFRRLMTEQRDRAKADARAKKGQHSDAHAYREVSDSIGRRGGVHRLRRGGLRGDGARHRRRRPAVATAGARGRRGRAGPGPHPVLRRGRRPARRPGRHRARQRRAPARCSTCSRRSPGLVVHQVKVLAGEVTVGEQGQALVDIERRKSISRAHTATHMVHKAFREALGDTATQAGSENAPGRFRFDFSATGAVPASAMADVEARVNDLVLADLGVQAEIMTQDEARKSGAMALFGEKYGDQVRVVSVGDWARELCGGTHAGRSGQLGVIKLLGESSIGSGVRRVEALVGADAYQFLAREHTLVAQLSETLKARPEELPERVARPRGAAAHRGEGDRAGARAAGARRGRASSRRSGQGRLRRLVRRSPRRRRGRRRRAQARARHPRPAAPGRAGRGGDHRLDQRQAGGRRRGQRRGAGVGHLRERAGRRRRRARSAAAVAARTTSPRAAART